MVQSLPIISAWYVQAVARKIALQAFPYSDASVVAETQRQTNVSKARKVQTSKAVS